MPGETNVRPFLYHFTMNVKVHVDALQRLWNFYNKFLIAILVHLQ